MVASNDFYQNRFIQLTPITENRSTVDQQSATRTDLRLLHPTLYVSTMPSNCEIFCEILIAVLLPPLGVCLRHGCCTVEFCICLLLTMLGYVPGIIYALYSIVFVDRDAYFDEYRRPLYYG